jgi:repressor LexA
VAAGVPIEAIAHQETMAVPDSFVQRGGNHYVLKVRGNSMIEEHIRDGDFVIINERQRADNGEMVIAMLPRRLGDREEVLPRARRPHPAQPANETMAPMYVHENDISIRGIVVGVMRRY